MGKIYSAPKEIIRPKWDFKDIPASHKEDDRYINEVKKFCVKNSTDPYAGKLVRFPVADGYAIYIVFSLKPVKLIHVDIGDAYQFDYANRLTKADLIEHIRRVDALNELFAKKKK